MNTRFNMSIDTAVLRFLGPHIMRPLTTPLLMGVVVLTAYPNRIASTLSLSKAKTPRPQHHQPQQQRQSRPRHKTCSSNRPHTNSSTFRSSCATDPVFVYGQPHQRLSHPQSQSAPPWSSRWDKRYVMALPSYGEGSRLGGGGNKGSAGGGGRRVGPGRGSGSLGSDDKSGAGGRGGTGRGGEPDGAAGSADAAALERLYSMPATESRRPISEGLGKGSPSARRRVRLQQENLELKWNMTGQQENVTICCRKCAGTGKCQCRFCDGTGMFKIGKELMVHPLLGRPPDCPVCRKSGEEMCKRCKGAGRIAAWLLRGNNLTD